MENAHVIIGIHVRNFSTQSSEIQKILSEYGCSIRTRLGLHNVADNACSQNGLILVEFIGGEAKADEMTAKLTAIKGVDVKRMVFEH